MFFWLVLQPRIGSRDILLLVCVCVTEKVSSMLSALIVPFKYMSPGPSSTEDEDTLSEYKTNMVDTITKNIVIVYKGSIQYL